MSDKSIRVTMKSRAQGACRDVLGALEVALQRPKIGLPPVPPRVLNALANAAEFIIDQTGGTIITENFRERLELAKSQLARPIVKARPRLRLVKS